MKTSKRLLAFVLCAVLLVGMLPAQTWAAEEDAVKVEHNGETTYYASLQKAFDGFAPGIHTYGGKYVVTLLADVSGNLNKVLSYPTEVLDITLDLNGHTITGDGTTIAVVFNLGSNLAQNSIITIKDSSGNNSGKITGGKGGVKLDGKNCTLKFEGGTITGNHGASKGGGIFMGATAKLVMTGGVITGNSVTGSGNGGWGGGVLANYADILGGTITGNTANGSSGNSGRGGGLCTEITRTKGYSTLNIADGVIYGNSATNAGDDVMAQGNGMSTTKFSLIIGKENWYIDGWNGKKATDGKTDRYSAENPVAYTDGGFTGKVNEDGSYAGVNNITLGLKYVAPAAQPDPTDAPVITTETTAEAVTVTAAGNGTVKLYKDGVEVENPFTVERTDAEQKFTFTATAQEEGKDLSEVTTLEVVVPAKEIVRPEQPELPLDNGSNVTSQLITIICDTEKGHTAKTYGWDDPAANFVFPKDSVPVWNEELGAWTISVRIDSIGAYYVGLQFSKEHNGIQHEIADGQSTIDTTLVWDAENKIWQTLTGEPFVVHVTCQDVPEVPQMGFHLGKFQIKLVGTVAGVEKIWHEFLHAETVTVGEVKGNRVDGFTVDVTVTLADGDAYLAAWLAKHAGGAEYVYDWSKTEKTVTFTMKYTGDTTGELYDGPEYWAAEGEKVYTAYLTAQAPAAPDKYGKNVTLDLVRVICDTDPDHAPLNIKWQHQSTKVRTWVSGVVWSEEYNTWIVPIRIDSIDSYYLWFQYEDTVNEINHDLVPDAPVPAGKDYIDTYLKWDEEAQLWITLDGNPIEIHVCCQTMPFAPTALPGSAQIQVKGDLDGDGIYGESKKDCALGVSELRTVNIPKTSGFTVGKVYGSREEGFFVDITVTLENGDLYISTWIENCAPGKDYVYNWDMTQKTITFTLKYNRSTTGTLYGDNTGDWVADYSGYKVGEAYVMPAQPAAPKQDNVTSELVTVICDSDGDRHAPVTGKWYPQHCNVLSTSEITWNAQLNAWTVDVKIGGLYIMYVDQLEDANGGTAHELVEDITTVYTTLKWDAAQGLWFPVEPIELHTTCRTAPVAPSYNQLKSYQVKVWGDVNGELKNWTTFIPEDGYTISDVYGSREEGFFVDVTITLTEGDVYQANWIANKNPGYFYNYDWDKTAKTVTFTLKYNGSLTGTLHGDRHAVNTNYDWVLDTNGKTYGVVSEAYLKQITCTVNLVIYRNGNTTTPYKTVSLGQIAKGETLDLSELDINEYYTSPYGFEMVAGYFNDGRWNQYKAGQNVTGLDEIYINGWTNIICMVTDYQPVKLVIYRNGNTTTPYKTINLDPMLKGDILDLTAIDVADYYSSTRGFEVVAGLYNDGRWNQYKAGQNVAGLDEIKINGWTNVICMVYDYQKIVVKGVVNGDKNTAETIFDGKVLYGENLIAWLDANVTVPEKPGYTADKWYNWDWYGHKHNDSKTVNGWTNVYVDYQANQYTLTLDSNGGKVDPSTITVTFDEAIGTLPAPTRPGYTFDGWVDADGNEVTAETIYTVIGDSTITAQWKIIPLKVYYYIDGEMVYSLVFETEAEITAFNVYGYQPVKTGYTLECWYEKAADIGNANKAEPNAEQNFLNKKVLRLYGSFVPNDIKLTLMDGEKVLLTIVDKAGEELTINTVPTKEGYTFAGWYTADGKAFDGVVPTVDTTYYASWTTNEYKVTLEETTDGEVTVDKQNPTYGETVTITVKPNAGMEVDGVTVTADGKAVTVTENADGTYSFTQPAGDVTVVVTFKAVETEEEPGDPTDPSEPSDSTQEPGNQPTGPSEDSDNKPATPSTGDHVYVEMLLAAMFASLAVLVLLIGKRRQGMNEA